MEKNFNNFKNSPVGYEIPQMDDNEVGIRDFTRKFESSDFVSSMFGHHVKDVIEPIKTEIDIDVDQNYDIYRREKRLTEEELMKKYGTIYPEFSGVEDFMEVERPADEKQEVEEVNINFEINKPQPVEPQINFNTVNFEQPKEDYTSATKLPPFLSSTQREEQPVVKNHQPEEVKSYSFGNNTNISRIETPVVASQEMKIDLKPTRKSSYQYPPLSLFNVPQRSSDENPDFLEENKEIINTTLKEFNVNGFVSAYTYGPTVTRYEISLAPGVAVKKIPNHAADIKMKLSAKTIRIEAPIPGKSTVGIEVPNRKAQMVHFLDLVNSREFQNNKNPLTIALGKDIDGKIICNDIAKMPHGLIAGATSSGKSVCINTLLISLLLKNSPEDLRLILIDPKQVELNMYNDIPHLITPVITDSKMASQSLRWAVDEMEKRYNQLTAVKARNIAEYNEYIQELTGYEKMPFIVIVIDELSDLMMTCGADVEDSVLRIAQKARAAGIHLILATQRPTTDVVKGTIKANIPIRIAFRVAQAIDSTTILDTIGAEALLGYGDMLIKTIEGMSRVQGAYLDGKDIDKVTSFIRDNNECNYVFTHDQLKTREQSKGSSDTNDDAELLHSAASFFIQKNNCSINALQTQFNLGFNRAQKVVEQLEKMNIVSPKSGTLAREVLVTQHQLDEMFNV